MADLRLFKQFIAVAEELSFRSAAVRLNMAQPPLTAAIKRLEDELGVVLIERSNRVTALTAAGQIFLEEARKTLAQADRTIQLTRRAAGGLSGSLRVGFIASAVRNVLPHLVADFRMTHPRIVLDLSEAPTARQVQAIKDDSMDIGLVVLPLPSGASSYLAVHPARDGTFVVALPAAHPLSAISDPLDLTDLAEQPWILFPENEGPGLYRTIIEACAQAGYLPQIAQRAVQMDTIIGLVSANLGIALVPDFLIHSGWEHVKFRPLKDNPIPYQMALIWRKNNVSPILKAFINSQIPE